jgi:pyrroloquinoline quinone biosynthesis protein D
MTGERYALSSDAVLQVTGDEGLILSLTAEDMFALNDTGVAIVRRVADGLAVDAVIDELVDAYQADRGAVADDVRALIGELVGRGLLVPAVGGPVT